jgi:hypothetical protein
MTYYEVRFFKKDGSCHRVKEFDNGIDAMACYDRAVEQSKALHDLDYSEIEGVGPEDILYYQIQVVARDEHMTWLGVNAEWNSGEGVVI